MLDGAIMLSFSMTYNHRNFHRFSNLTLSLGGVMRLNLKNKRVWGSRGGRRLRPPAAAVRPFRAPASPISNLWPIRQMDLILAFYREKPD